MYKFLSKLVCLQMTTENALAYNEICQFSVNYESVMFFAQAK
jgi:nitroimidazol reductase NimA-like FMN-containing flavoprotein (pyridoxamine 5'-phosphate oxidase superfamily)